MARARSGPEPKQFTKWYCGTLGRSFPAAVSDENKSFAGTGAEDGTNDSGRNRKELQRSGTPGPGLACAHHPGHESVATGARYSGGDLARKHAGRPIARVCHKETEWCGPVERATSPLARTASSRLEASGVASLLPHRGE